jgi:hypothetical protein
MSVAELIVAPFLRCNQYELPPVLMTLPGYSVERLCFRDGLKIHSESRLYPLEVFTPAYYS